MNDDFRKKLEADIFDGLNPEQKKAVETTEGPLLILAGAGSGKTRVIIHRIANLVRLKNVPPWQVLAVTFTNKAAREMKERLAAKLGPMANDTWLSTFHSLGLRLLRYEAKEIGLDSNFTVYDSSDQLVLIKKCMKELELNPKEHKPKSIANMINKAKDNLIGPEEFEPDSNHPPTQDALRNIYTLYEKRKKQNAAFDFADLLFQAVMLLKKFPEVRKKYQNRWKYIMVDEYQDTNHAQYLLTKLLAEAHGNIAVVGDDDQSIYSWRGAIIKNILDFEKDYLDCVQIKLEQNYRSTKNILQAANSVILNNKTRKNKQLWTEKDSGDKIELTSNSSEFDEARSVLRKARELRRSGFDLKDIAIFYRTNSQSRSLEEVFRRENIPYKIIGGLNFYERKEIKDIVAYLNLIVNPACDVSFLRIVNFPARGIGNTSIERINNYALYNGLTLYKALQNHESISGVQAKKIQPFLNLIESFKQLIEKDMELPKIVEQIIKDTEIKKYYEADKSIESESRLENIEEFKNSVAAYHAGNKEAGLMEFLQDISLFTSAEDTRVEESDDFITMMTVHNAKGLEFPIVFLTGLEEDIFPHYLSLNDTDNNVEEERRLCYVGMTRAMQKLFISTASTRYVNGMSRRQRPSRFLMEIKPETVQGNFVNSGSASLFGDSTYDTPSAYVSPGKKLGFLNDTSSNLEDDGWGNLESYKPPETEQNENWKKGNRVEHAKYGRGIIVNVTGQGKNQKLLINFTGLGVKHFAAKYAKLKKL